jgi:exoribonuclease R
MNVIIHHWQKNKYEPVQPAPATLHTLKWMPGDIVSSTTGAVIKRTCGRVVGIVDVLNRTRFGTTARGVPLYIMYPIDVTYPPFLVALKTKPAGNILAVARYEHWEGIWPRAGLESQIGIVGDLKSELEAMVKTLPLTPKSMSLPEVDATKHVQTDWDVVLHIDPSGCKDVDDVLCWKHRGDIVHFAIGIADVAFWIAEGSDLDRCAFERGATLYRDGVAIEPMLPTHISESLASLRCDDNLRPAVCLTFDLVRSENGIWKCNAGRWELHMLRVTESYTYDSIHSNSERASQVREYLSAVCGYGETELGFDSHEWIERAMILYNRRVGEELQRAGVGLLRAHAGTTNEDYMTLAMETGCREIGWLGSAAGTYVAPCDNTGHMGLSLACYTHASSPLRRYVDLLNQRWIRALFFGFPAPVATEAVHEYNLRSKRIRRLERDMYFLNRTLAGAGTSEFPTAAGFVLEIKKSHGGMEKWRVYVPEWKRVVSCVFVRGLEDDEVKKGTRVTVRMYLDTRQGDWSRRFIYQSLKQST